jgi:aminoglycoside phosphotransferase (APT) family kinase protein
MPRTVAWAVRALGASEAVDVRLLHVGSTAVHILRVSLRGGAETDFILRRFVDGQRLHSDPWYVPRHEATALELLETVSVPTPRLVAADVDASDCEVPTLLTTCVPGRPGGGSDVRVSERMLVQLAQALPMIQGVYGRAHGRVPAYAPYYRAEDVQVPQWSTCPSAWRRAIDLLRGGVAPATEVGFLHRDYHPGNTLWDGQRLSGIVDWTTGCVGPPGVDLARMRNNLAYRHGPGAAEQFLRVYVSETGCEQHHHPWWDLVDAVDMLVDTPAPADGMQADRLRQWEQHVARAVDGL